MHVGQILTVDSAMAREYESAYLYPAARIIVKGVFSPKHGILNMGNHMMMIWKISL